MMFTRAAAVVFAGLSLVSAGKPGALKKKKCVCEKTGWVCTDAAKNTLASLLNCKPRSSSGCQDGMTHCTIGQCGAVVNSTDCYGSHGKPVGKRAYYEPSVNNPLDKSLKRRQAHQRTHAAGKNPFSTKTDVSGACSRTCGGAHGTQSRCHEFLLQQEG